MKEELINKLPQLDRIELRQKIFELNNTSGGVGGSFVLLLRMMWVMLIITIPGIMLRNIDVETSTIFLNIVHMVLPVAIIFFCITFFLDIISFYIYINKKKRIYSSYFVTGVRKIK